jgi:hypothetical protein
VRGHGGRSRHSPTHVLDRSCLPSAVLACPPPFSLVSPCLTSTSHPRVALSCLVSPRLVSSRVASSRVVSPCVVSLVSSRLVSPRLVSPRLVSCCLVLSRLVLPRLVLSRVASCCLVLSRLVLSRLASCHVVSSRVVSLRVVSCHLVFVLSSFGLRVYTLFSCQYPFCKLHSPILLYIVAQLL